MKTILRSLGLAALALTIGGTVMQGVTVAPAGHLVVGQQAQAGTATAEQAQALLARAVAKIKADGQDAALKAFSDRQGGFIEGELYVFVFDMKGIYLASGGNPALVGMDAIDLKDAEGKALVREMVALAKGKGEGSVDYVWLNRATNKVEHKRSLIQKVGDSIVGVGYYHE